MDLTEELTSSFRLGVGGGHSLVLRLTSARLSADELILGISAARKMR